MTRPSWDEYFMGLARHASTRATCDRKHVGAVLVRDRRVLATGYNGSMRGSSHCDEAGHLIVAGHCVRTVHAEANAVASAAGDGIGVRGADCYVTAFPCFGCFKLLANAGIRRVMYAEAYRVDDQVVAECELHDTANRIIWMRQ